MFTQFIAILLLYAAHIILIYAIRGLKRNIAAGVDFSLTAAILAGIWFGPKWGFIIGVIFEITNYFVQMEFYPSLLLLIPCTGLIGVYASFAFGLGIGIMPLALFGVLGYAIITDIGMFTLFGERDYVMMVCYFIGVMMTNWIFFDLFF